MTLIPIPAFNDNYIWLLGDETGRAVIVDPGDAGPVLSVLAREHWQPAAIVVTHHHGDHIGGVRQLQQRYDLPVYAPARESIPGTTHPVRDGDQVTPAAGFPCFRVFEVPGHTRGHIAYYGDGLLFCGDTLFAGGCGRLFEGTAEQMYASLCRLAGLPASTAIYCAHEYTQANLRFAAEVEPDNEVLQERLRHVAERRRQQQPTVPSTLSDEQATNPFLRSHLEPLAQAAGRYAGTAVTPGVETFAVLRRWKDHWRG